MNGNEVTVRLLLDHGADIKHKDEHGQTPLHCIAMNEHEAVVRLLLDRGADTEQKDELGWTPL